MPLRRLLILLMNLCLLLSLSAQALSAAAHPCVGDAAVLSDAPVDHSGMDHDNMDHSGMDHSGMEHSNMAKSTMDCCEGADDCPMDQCVILPVALAAYVLAVLWLPGASDFPAPVGATARAVYPPYHPPFFA